MPATPHTSGSSPYRPAYARIEASPARACFAEAVAPGDLGEDGPGGVAADHGRRACWLRHLSIDFLEKTQAPLSWSEGVRRSVASCARVRSSIARYVEASLMLSTSFGVTNVPPPCVCAASPRPPRARGSGP